MNMIYLHIHILALTVQAYIFLYTNRVYLCVLGRRFRVPPEEGPGPGAGLQLLVRLATILSTVSCSYKILFEMNSIRLSM